MTRKDLLYKLTGTDAPRFVNKRENIIIVKCLDIINGLEANIEELQKRNAEQGGEIKNLNDQIEHYINL